MYERPVLLREGRPFCIFGSAPRAPAAPHSTGDIDVLRHLRLSVDSTRCPDRAHIPTTDGSDAWWLVPKSLSAEEFGTGWSLSVEGGQNPLCPGNDRGSVTSVIAGDSGGRYDMSIEVLGLSVTAHPSEAPAS
jgi:hypothetical protein